MAAEQVNASDKVSVETVRQNVGKRVHKTSKEGTEPKPFKSGRKINTIKDVVEHPILKVPAYTFEEDDSYVDCRKCVVI